MTEFRAPIERRNGYDVVRVESRPDERGVIIVVWRLARCPFCDGPHHAEPCPEVGFRTRDHAR